MRMARAGDTPTDEAALVNAVVLNGPGGLRVLRLDSTDFTTPGDLVLASADWASASSQNLSTLWCATNSPSGCSNAANTSQYGLGTCARRSSSRSTTIASVGLCTR